MSDWQYYVVENCFVVRTELGAGRAERLMRDGSWIDYPDTYDVATNGRWLKDEARAKEVAQKLFAMLPELE